MRVFKEKAVPPARLRGGGGGRGHSREEPVARQWRWGEAVPQGRRPAQPRAITGLLIPAQSRAGGPALKTKTTCSISNTKPFSCFRGYLTGFHEIVHMFFGKFSLEI